jgi:transketolase
MTGVLDAAEFKRIEDFARRLRVSIVSMLAAAGSGHSAGPLGMADFMAVLYTKVLRHDPSNPDWPERDVFFLSHGHTAPVLYAALAESGYFPKAELQTLRALGSRLQGHPERGALPGIESTSGPLGSGLSQAAGYAYALRFLRPDPQRRIYVAMGDGELDEGNIWEAAMFAAACRLDNLIGIVDRNRIQIDGDTEDVMPLGDLAAKWRAFGWSVLDVDGHNLNDLFAAFAHARESVGRPTVLIARTIPGRGVSFMESDYRWHGKPPSPEQRDEALAEINKKGRRS